jgi:hypothetical protein
MSQGLKRALRGLVAVVVGAILTYVSYRLAANSQVSNGSYIVTGGVFIVGGWYIISGLYMHFKKK